MDKIKKTVKPVSSKVAVTGTKKPQSAGEVDWFIPIDVRKEILANFNALKEPVTLEIFIKEGENDQYSAFTTLFCMDLSRLSGKIKVNFNLIGEKRSKELKVTRSPSILVDPDKLKIRFTGAPLGHEGRSLIGGIILASEMASGLKEGSRTALAALKEPRAIQVFVSPGCPYCPEQVLNAFRAAVERPDLITAECIEATQNIELANKYNVAAVPHTVINGKTISKGLEPEDVFIGELVSLEPSKLLTHAHAAARAELETIDVDLIIVGGGPAGLTAGIYAQRSGLSSIVLEKSVLGGQVALTPVVENYPAFTNIGGKQLMDLISAHARSYVEIHEGEEILEIKIGRKIEAITDQRRYFGKGLILATGAQHRKLNVPGEDKYSGIGVSYCATCDGFLFKGKNVIVVGGGNSAMTDALFLKTLGANVTIVHRRDSFRAQKFLQEALKRQEIPVIWNAVVEEILGEERKLNAVKLKSIKDDTVKIMNVDGVFIAIGEDPATKLAADIGIKLNDEGFITVDQTCRTNIPRIYAAGDVTGGVRQIVTAVAAGSVAALSAFEDIMNPYWLKSSGFVRNNTKR